MFALSHNEGFLNGVNKLNTCLTDMTLQYSKQVMIYDELARLMPLVRPLGHSGITTSDPSREKDVTLCTVVNTSCKTRCFLKTLF
jgi:hypothetical protein